MECVVMVFLAAVFDCSACAGGMGGGKVDCLLGELVWWSVDSESGEV